MIGHKKCGISREIWPENILNEIHLFCEEYNTKRQQNTTENQGGDEREGLTLHAGLLPVLQYETSKNRPFISLALD